MAWRGTLGCVIVLAAACTEASKNSGAGSAGSGGAGVGAGRGGADGSEAGSSTIASEGGGGTGAMDAGGAGDGDAGGANGAGVSGSGIAGSSSAGEGAGSSNGAGGAGAGDAGGAGGDGSATFTDPRDGETYEVAVIPISFGQGAPLQYLWLAENLRWQPPVGFSHCADGSPESCRALGRFYDYVAALNGSPPGDQGACPDGWRLPTEGFLQEMITWNGAHQQLTNKLKSTSGWATMQGLDQWGFNGRPVGYYGEDLSDTERHGLGEWALYWGSSVAWGLPDKAPAYVFYNWGGKAQLNVRCFKAL